MQRFTVTFTCTAEVDEDPPEAYQLLMAEIRKLAAFIPETLGDEDQITLTERKLNIGER